MRYRRRAFDVALSSMAIVLFLPVFLIIALIIWLDDRRPILFRQKRLGRHGNVFTVFKFRKFSALHDRLGPAVTVTGDARYSRIGKYLELTKFNELPQIFNVFIGDMSFVGPRPELPEFKRLLDDKHPSLLNFKPGIFGPSQTLFRNEALMYPSHFAPETFYATVLLPAKADIDVNYYRSATLRSDVYWIYRSLEAVVLGQCSPILDKQFPYVSGVLDKVHAAIRACDRSITQGESREDASQLRRSGGQQEQQYSA